MIVKNSFADYRKSEGINISSLIEIAESPLHFRWCLDNPKDSKSLVRGRAIHQLILEPEFFNDVYAVEPDKKDYAFVTVDDLKPLLEKYAVKKASKKEDTIKSLSPFLSSDEMKQVYDLVYSAFLMECEGKEILSAKEFQEASNIANVLLSNDKIANLLKRGQKEISIYQEINWVKCKGRLDYLADEFFLDYKSCRDCSPREFERDFFKYGYHIKLAYYQWMAFLETGKMLPCIVIAQSTSDECDFVIREVDQRFLDMGRDGWMDKDLVKHDGFVQMLEKYKDCLASGKWEGLSKDITTLFAPNFMLSL